MNALILAAALLPMAGAGPEKVLVLDMDCKDKDLGRTVDGVIAVEMDRLGEFDVLSSNDLRAVLNAEATKTAVGCEDSSCLVELADAMGASLVSYGHVATLNKAVVLTLHMFNAKTGKSIGREIIQVQDLDNLPAEVRNMLARMNGKPVEASATGVPVLASSVLGVGLGVAVLGALGMTFSWLTTTDQNSTGGSKKLAADVYTPSIIAVAVGVAAAGIGAGLWAFGE